MRERNPRCSYCGKFVSLINAIRYTSYGNCYDVEPPDEEYICQKCWGTLNNSEKELTYRTSWIKPRSLL